MKRLFLSLVILFIGLPCFALEKIDYKNLKQNAKLVYADGIWSVTKSDKSDNVFVKKVSDGVTKYSEFYSKDGEHLFSTGTHYEFIDRGRLIGYSNNDLKFYEYNFDENILTSRELIKEEVQELFPEYVVVCLSDFTTTTNSYVLKSKDNKIKLILLNDTDNYFDNYNYSTVNAKYKNYDLKGFLHVKKKGMLHFASSKNNSLWYVLIIR